MTSLPLVSILIPCHNAAPWLAQTLSSAIDQTWPCIEIILVDDGSEDDSWAIAQAFAQQHNQERRQTHGLEPVRIELLKQEKQGASAARNRAFQASRGEWIQYLDADDLLAPDKIERQMQAVINHAAGANTYLWAGEWARFQQQVGEADFSPQPAWGDHDPVDWLCLIWHHNWMMHPAAWLFSRNLAERAGAWDEQLSLNDDGEYFCRVALASKGIRFVKEARSYYRSGNRSSLSGDKSDAAWGSAFRSISCCRDHLLAQENSPRTRQAIATLFQRFIYEVYPQVPALRQQAQQQVISLGPVQLSPPGSPLFRWISQLLGWQQAKRLWLWRRQLMLE